VVLSAAESSSVAAGGSVAVWESWEARETMVMSASLERPLAADPGDPDVVPALGAGDKRLEVDLHAVQCGYRKGSPLRHGHVCWRDRTTTIVAMSTTESSTDPPGVLVAAPNLRFRRK
jgi:hypothetical protein